MELVRRFKNNHFTYPFPTTYYLIKHEKTLTK